MQRAGDLQVRVEPLRHLAEQLEDVEVTEHDRGVGLLRAHDDAGQVGLELRAWQMLAAQAVLVLGAGKHLHQDVRQLRVMGGVIEDALAVRADDGMLQPLRKIGAGAHEQLVGLGLLTEIDRDE